MSIHSISSVKVSDSNYMDINSIPQHKYIKPNGVDKTPQSDVAEFSGKKNNKKKGIVAAAVAGALATGAAIYMLVTKGKGGKHIPDFGGNIEGAVEGAKSKVTTVMEEISGKEAEKINTLIESSNGKNGWEIIGAETTKASNASKGEKAAEEIFGAETTKASNASKGEKAAEEIFGAETKDAEIFQQQEKLFERDLNDPFDPMNKIDPMSPHYEAPVSKGIYGQDLNNPFDPLNEMDIMSPYYKIQ